LQQILNLPRIKHSSLFRYIIRDEEEKSFKTLAPAASAVSQSGKPPTLSFLWKNITHYFQEEINAKLRTI
jgi:hypothetical protein